MKLQQNEKIAILGASRGLGAQIAEHLKTQHPEVELFLASRKLNQFDFSKRDSWDEYLRYLQSFEPTRIIYCAGGGPYGAAQNFQWKDHEWSYLVTFLFPAYLLHRVLAERALFSSLRQVIFIGSSVAEDKPDPFASSYCASKHALKGLVESIRLENPPVSVELFSPGYMDTDLLPPGSKARKQGPLAQPKDVASTLFDLLL